MTISDRLRTKLSELKSAYDGSGDPTGNIRSGSIIGHLEDWCAEELGELGIPSSEIVRDFKATGFFKTKTQDISVRCQTFGCSVHGQVPPLTINVRSQLSSIQKNYDTLFERVVAEALNLHLAQPEHVAGYVYLIPVWGYDEKALKSGQVELTEDYQRKKYVESFEQINLRSGPADEKWKYERICLLTVDFSSDPPEPVVGLPVRQLDQSLYPGLDTSRIWKCLHYDDFFSDLLDTARRRFDPECVTY